MLYYMPKFEKGSKEAKQWGAKMKKAREAKKVSGGMMPNVAMKGDPFGLSKGGKKISLKRDNDRTPSPPKKVMKNESPIDETPVTGFKSIAKIPENTTNVKAIKSKGKKGNAQFVKRMKGGMLTPDEQRMFLEAMRPTEQERQQNRQNMLTPDEQRMFLEAMMPNSEEIQQNTQNMLTPDEEGMFLEAMMPNSEEEKQMMKLLRRQAEDKKQMMTLLRRQAEEKNKWQETVNEDIVNNYQDGELAKQLLRIPGVAREVMIRRQEGRGIKGGYLQPGEIPLASTNEALIAEKKQYAPVEMSAATDEEIDGMGMCMCHKCEMCGGKIKGIRKGLTKVGKAFGKVGEALNPMSYALKDKSTRDAMIASGDVTQNYALPAVTTAGLPLYYGAAGTAGMLVGGPLGAMAATKAADELYKGMVVKPGYDPQQRQKSKTLGVVSKEVGKLGAANLKQGSSAPKSTAPKSGGVAQAGKGVRKSKKKKLIIIE